MMPLEFIPILSFLIMKIQYYEEFDRPEVDGGQVIRFIWCEEIPQLHIGDYIELGELGQIYRVLHIFEDHVAILEI